MTPVCSCVKLKAAGLNVRQPLACRTFRDKLKVCGTFIPNCISTRTIYPVNPSLHNLLFLGPYKFERANQTEELPRDNFVG